VFVFGKPFKPLKPSVMFMGKAEAYLRVDTSNFLQCDRKYGALVSSKMSMYYLSG